VIEDPEIIDALGVKEYYNHVFSFDTFDGILQKSAEEISDIVKKLPKGQISSIIYRARHLIDEGKLDSLRGVRALEDALGVQLIETEE
jgi:hypothetical protein